MPNTSIDSAYNEQYESFDYTPVSEFHLRLAKGEIPNSSTVFKFGRSEAIGLTEIPIWDGDAAYTFLAAAEFINVVSASANDTALGSGATTIIMYGLDTNFNEISEVITMNGTTPVKSTKEYLRLFRAIVLTTGTPTPVAGSNLGIISFTSFTTTTLQARIKVGEGQTLMAIYTVPAGKTAYITGAVFSVGSGKSCTFRGKFRNCTTPNCSFSNKFTLELYQASEYLPFITPLRVPEKTDMVITGINGTPAIAASASWGMILIDN